MIISYAESFLHLKNKQMFKSDTRMLYLGNKA
ncbi:hypothetical protein V462_15070 [Pantoea ananatis 15320]|nr:hypothetical protein L585_08190 [Pantoea ananatis BRT175]PKC33676.1 hypothetical protein V462_15070 [Pantoea ananatis 15320]PKC46155.1 hypothetical protein V461_05665 [Pantoea ananatis BRT98]